MTTTETTTRLELFEVELSSLKIGKRHRAVDKFKVASLAKSMEAIGLQQPISVFQDGNAIHLIVGLHRVEAAKQLGWKYINAMLVALDEIDRELWEIDENLMRADLSAAEERKHYKRRKELWEQRQVGVSGQNDPKPQSGPKGGRPKGFASEMAEKTGKSKRQINRLIADPKPAADELVGQVSDEFAELDEIPPGLERRQAKLAEANGKKPKPASADPKQYAARPMPKPRSGKPVLGLEASFRQYIDKCAEPDVDLDFELKRVAEALREIAGKRDHKANGSAQPGLPEVEMTA